ncbi:MAG: zinc-ribbon domain-containing protein [Alphaproteobacteria bacterium]|nr:zinc-ribbon domain-containing protein [Alphaproteobacteria bacterium]
MRRRRAIELATDVARRDVSALKAGRPVPRMVLANRDVLTLHNKLPGDLPTYYMNRLFTCHDCGKEEIWTAREQRWWFEVLHRSIRSVALRCSACRKARRGLVGVGANLLREQCARLRSLAERPPSPAALAEIKDALNSKWWGVRIAAIQTLGRWGGAEEVARLEAIVATGRAARKCWGRDWEVLAGRVADKALRRLFPDRS